MGWRKVARKEYDCDGCGATLLDPEFEVPVTYPEGAVLTDYDRDHLEDIGWTYFVEVSAETTEVRVLAYCPNCWHLCEAGSLSHPGRPGKAEDCTAPDCIEARGA